MMSQDKPTVLYVDDLPMNLKLFEATFKNDYHIILTESPREALEILNEKEKDIQVLVSDQRMPEMTGTELLEIVSREYPDIRRYLLTAYTDTETVIEGVNKGRIHGYIRKPMQPDDIRQSINNSLEVYYLRKKNQQMMEELEKANEELLHLDSLKSEIIQSISNEISTPLNRIMGTLHLLKSKIQGDELSEVVNILDHSVFKLEQFSMLARQISQLKSPDFQLKRNKVSLKQVIQFGIIETGDELKEQEITLTRELKSPDQDVEGDSGLLVSCLVSLIRFAREHTELGGEIVVRTTMEQERPVCCVRDQGAGYSDTTFEVFEKHFSDSNAVLNLSMGIGLALSQLIMEAHGGRLDFERTGDKRGCIKMVFPAQDSSG